jgi:hypothetical protein
MFLHQVGSACHVVHSGATKPQNIYTLFFILGWAQCGFHKMSVGTYHTELVFLHQVISASHVEHSDAPGA